MDSQPNAAPDILDGVLQPMASWLKQSAEAEFNENEGLVPEWQGFGNPAPVLGWDTIGTEGVEFERHWH